MASCSRTCSIEESRYRVGGRHGAAPYRLDRVRNSGLERVQLKHNTNITKQDFLGTARQRTRVASSSEDLRRPPRFQIFLEFSHHVPEVSIQKQNMVHRLPVPGS